MRIERETAEEIRKVAVTKYLPIWVENGQASSGTVRLFASVKLTDKIDDCKINSAEFLLAYKVMAKFNKEFLDVNTEAARVPLIGYETFDRFSISFNVQGSSWKEICAYISGDETRYFMHGVHFSPNGDIVATNGRRLLVLKGALSPFEKLEYDLIIHSEFLAILPEKGEIRIQTAPSRQKLIFCQNGVEFSVESIQGKFPHYLKVIPENQPYSLVFPAEEIQKAAMLTPKKGSRRAMFEGGIYKGSPENPINIPDCTLAINAEFMGDVQAYNKKETEYKFSYENMIKAFVYDKDNKKIVIMPMQLD
jgi:hypothetical protein